MNESNNLEDIALRIRGELVKISNQANTPHLGSSLSCVDILVAAYWGALNVDPNKPDSPDRDRLIFSKGHAATTLYLALNMKGFISDQTLATYAKSGGLLPEHPVYKSAPGIEVTSGSLGHGLPLGLGIAVSARIHKIDYRVYVVMSDGECNEGSVWEAAMAAPQYKLDSIVAIIDKNNLQQTGTNNEIMSVGNLVSKWERFDWQVYEIDGHNVKALQDLML